MTQFCIEEAALIAYDLHVEREERREEAERQEAERKPGQITDPVMADAMAKAKEIHLKTFGVQT